MLLGPSIHFVIPMMMVISSLDWPSCDFFDRALLLWSATTRMVDQSASATTAQSSLNRDYFFRGDRSVNLVIIIVKEFVWLSSRQSRTDRPWGRLVIGKRQLITWQWPRKWSSSVNDRNFEGFISERFEKLMENLVSISGLIGFVLALSSNYAKNLD